MSLNPIPNGPGLLVSVKTGLDGKDWVLEAGGWVMRRILGVGRERGGGSSGGLELSGRAGVPMNRGKSWETFVEGKA